MPKLTSLYPVAHKECAQSLKEDLEAGLIYGPYAIARTDILNEQTCTVCKGKGSWTTYTNDPINGERAGKPAPCEFCHGKGTRPVLQFITMEEWAKLNKKCAYCGGTR